MRRRWLPLAVIAFASLSTAPAASADSTQSSNWAGYAVHHHGVRLSKVSGTARRHDRLHRALDRVHQATSPTWRAMMPPAVIT
jgi:hypothetical protein